jgi:hypothetical protein
MMSWIRYVDTSEKRSEADDLQPVHLMDLSTIRRQILKHLRGRVSKSVLLLLVRGNDEDSR